MADSSDRKTLLYELSMGPEGTLDRYGTRTPFRGLFLRGRGFRWRIVYENTSYFKLIHKTTHQPALEYANSRIYPQRKDH